MARMSFVRSQLALTALGLTLSALRTNCSPNKSNNSSESEIQKPKDETFRPKTITDTLQIVDQYGKPVAAAQIFIGEVFLPTPGDNLVVADADGRSTIPTGWTTAQPVTIQAPGYLRVTYLNQTPGTRTYVLRKVETDEHLELSGVTTGFNVVNNDNKVDFALTVPALRKSDFLAFDINKFISSENDKITIIGNDIKIPSNISLPKQIESYWLQITLNKPKYRIYFHSPGPKTVLTLRGQFPLDDVVDDLRDKKEFYEVINYFSIFGGSIRETTVTGKKNSLDLPVNELSFKDRREVVAPSFGSDEAILAAALTEYKGLYIPTDVKNMSSKGKMNLVTSGAQPLLVAVMKKRGAAGKAAKDQLSARLMPMLATATSPDLLPLIPAPKANLHVVEVQPPVAPASINALATYATLYKIEQVTQDGKTSDAPRLVWEVYGADWSKQMKLPEWPATASEKWSGRMKWSVALMGTDQPLDPAKPVDLGPSLVDSVTHVTYNAQEFQNP